MSSEDLPKISKLLATFLRYDFLIQPTYMT